MTQRIFIQHMGGSTPLVMQLWKGTPDGNQTLLSERPMSTDPLSKDDLYDISAGMYLVIKPATLTNA